MLILDRLEAHRRKAKPNPKGSPEHCWIATFPTIEDDTPTSLVHSLVPIQGKSKSATSELPNPECFPSWGKIPKPGKRATKPRIMSSLTLGQRKRLTTWRGVIGSCRFFSGSLLPLWGSVRKWPEPKLVHPHLDRRTGRRTRRSRVGWRLLLLWVPRQVTRPGTSTARQVYWGSTSRYCNSINGQKCLSNSTRQCVKWKFPEKVSNFKMNWNINNDKNIS